MKPSKKQNEMGNGSTLWGITPLLYGVNRDEFRHEFLSTMRPSDWQDPERKLLAAVLMQAIGRRQDALFYRGRNSYV